MRLFCFMMLTGALMIVSVKEARASAQGELTVLAMGDSTTAGTPGFFSPAEKPPTGLGNEKSQYAYWILQRHPGWTIYNRGVRGQRTDQILRRFKREVDQYPADVVVVLAGVNDLHQGYSVADVTKNLQEFYELAVAKNKKVLACTILPYNLAIPEVRQRILEANEWIRAYGREHGFLFCDTYTLLNDVKNPGNLISTPDDIHPDEAGYRRMGEEISKILERVVR